MLIYQRVAETNAWSLRLEMMILIHMHILFASICMYVMLCYVMQCSVVKGYVMHACMHACMYVCMYACTRTHAYT